MSDEAAPRPSRRWVKWMSRIFLYTFAVLLILPLLPINLPIEFFGLLLFGWVPYLSDVLPRATFNPEIAFEALIVLTLAVFGLHRLLLWWTRKWGGSIARWRVAWTIKISASVLLLFATSIAATGIVHQIGWLLHSDLLIYDWSRVRMVKELSNLKQVNTGLRLFTEDHGGKFPADLEELIPDYMDTRDFFYSSLAYTEPHERILYFPFDGKALPAEWIVLAGPQPERRPGRIEKRSVVRFDGSGEAMKEPEFQKRLAAQKSGSPLLRRAGEAEE